MKTLMRASAFLSILTVSGVVSISSIAPASAQSVCQTNRYNQVVCRQRANIYNQRWNNGRQSDNYYRLNDWRYVRDRVNIRRDVRDIYQDVLGRDADRNGLRQWSRGVRSGESFDDVRRGIAGSPEARDAINKIYRDVLGRDADPSGLQGWQDGLRDGRSLQDIRRSIENSEEARNRRQPAADGTMTP
jgi:hypothetical protein